MERETITRRRLSDEVVDRLEGLIHSGEFELGDQLPSERDLMERFSVGRPSVREALFSLQKMGLVAINSGERARVTRPTPETVLNGLTATVRHMLTDGQGVRHMQEARLFFEAGLARDAARHADDGGIARLQEALMENHQALGDMQAFEQTDVNFHYVLAEIPKNPVFVAIHEAVVEWLTEQRHKSLMNKGAAQGAYDWHAKIFRAVAGHDVEGAEAAMRGHLGDVSQLYWRAEGSSKTG
ncbi:MAG: transcriptional regulator NanR [Rhodospirillaceae bacterium]|nr:transcriptional regulator NanR [Rhodospirillaceae bacterium]MBT3626715.1 transcriptional regulator NanR [Rhodospirillaceae bacterium]MBT5040556.1 transcriptional regulator NanR [Rhodospirillaceae bacterium]MBT5777934.1 transcriptional regulator NanR [Rhodospirillaceae bacterium]MBT6828639.1 transcriptional regulator NanR [Rhodospirillaceae bacterium]